MVMRAVRRSLLADWDYVENQKAWEYRVKERVAKHLARARKWEEEMAAVGDDDKARVFDDRVRRERVRRGSMIRNDHARPRVLYCLIYQQQ